MVAFGVARLKRRSPYSWSVGSSVISAPASLARSHSASTSSTVTHVMSVLAPRLAGLR